MPASEDLYVLAPGEGEGESDGWVSPRPIDEAVRAAVTDATDLGPDDIDDAESYVDLEEVAAVLAHEQAHIDHGDTTLGLVLPLVGALTLTGQNVLFDLFDVAEREHRADIAAAERLDTPTPLLSAFDRLDDLPERARSGRPAGTGTLGALPVGGLDGGAFALLTRPFRLFFGSFALTDVHPSIADRRQRVREAFGTE